MALGFDFMLVPGATPKKPASGLIGVELPVLAELHPGDVVADGLGRPARNGRLDHREVGLAARRRERRSNVVALSSGEVSLRISMCSASQPSSRAIAEAIRSA